MAKRRTFSPEFKLQVILGHGHIKDEIAENGAHAGILVSWPRPHDRLQR